MQINTAPPRICETKTMNAVPETSCRVVSLRGHRAWRLYRRYRQLPESLRSPTRTRIVAQYILDYAYESAPTDRFDWEASRQVCHRLQEFLPGQHDQDADNLMAWMHENLLPEAMQKPADLEEFVVDYLRW